ncbi:putative type IX sorting system protein PorV2 [Mesonia oceanica]|uniref:putative type IX sorting system protein PorV2 n=2 Tax=Mesonia TaxID=232115 RepID=UPI00269FD1AE
MRSRLLFIFILLGPILFAQSVRKYSNEFMNIGVDAAAFGMANSVVATTNDVNAAYWNPAGLMELEDNQISLMHASYFANIANYDYIAGAMPLDRESAVAFSVIRFGVDNIMNTTQLIEEDGQINYDNISYFSAADYAFTLSYARNLPLEGFRYGVNAKVIRRVIGKFANSWGFGFDASIQFEGDNGWKFGAMARDITTTYNTWSIDEDEYSSVQGAIEGQNQELPETTEITIPKLQLGVAKTFTIHYDFDIKTELDMHMRFAQTNDIISTSSVSATPSFGFEVGYIDLVYLRGGVGNFQNVEQFDNSTKVGFQPGFGVGFQYKGIHLDYAFTDIGDQSVALYSNVFSLKIDWSLFR